MDDNCKSGRLDEGKLAGRKDVYGVGYNVRRNGYYSFGETKEI